MRAWLRRRDEYLAEGRALGYSLRQLGDAAGMTASGVKKVLDRNAPPAPPAP